MTEPRMRARQKGQQFDTKDLTAFLIAYGDDYSPLPETIRTLDEIVTDYIIEMSHAAALTATTSHRAKIKVDDFKFALRRDPKKLGRVTELLVMDKDIKRKRKAFDVEDEAMQKEGKKGRKAAAAPSEERDEEDDPDGEDGESGKGKKKKKSKRGPGRPPKDRSGE